MVAYPIALTIAGSDSGGGAGIQADLRTFAFHLVHGASVITCVTAQNTMGVTQVGAIDTQLVAAQIETVATDIGANSVKLGMLLNQEIMQTVAEQLRKWQFSQVVLDPVMVSRTGAQLIDQGAVNTLKAELLPQALIVTPNLYEAQILSEQTITSRQEMEEAAVKIHSYGSKIVVVKGGAMPGKLQGLDVYFDGENCIPLPTKAVNTKNNHGTGCTLGAAIAANLAWGKSPLVAVVQAKEYVTKALEQSLDMGKGHGPIGHFFPLLTKDN